LRRRFGNRGGRQEEPGNSSDGLHTHSTLAGTARRGGRPTRRTGTEASGWSRCRRVVVECTLKPVNPSPQGTFWDSCEEEFSFYITSLTPEEADAFQIIGLYRQRGDAANVFNDLKIQWGFPGFCARKAEVSQSAARLLLLVYNLWSLFVRLVKNMIGHTVAIKSRCELLLIPAKLVCSGRSKTVKLAVGVRFWSFLKQVYQSLLEWLG
jgi:hypothetical protein